MSSTLTESSNRSAVLVGQDNQTTAADDANFQAISRGNRSGTLKLRGIPTFSDASEKRKWMREHMAAAFRFFGKKGYGEGISGHISMRGMYTDRPVSSFPTETVC